MNLTQEINFLTLVIKFYQRDSLVWQFWIPNNGMQSHVIVRMFWKIFCSVYTRANSFMSTILTFILFFVYFPLCGRKTYLGFARGDNGAGSRKIYYWDLFTRVPSTDIAKVKVMNDTCFEILPALNCFPRRKFHGMRSLFVVKYVGVLRERVDFYNAADQAIFLLVALYCRAIRLKGIIKEWGATNWMRKVCWPILEYLFALLYRQQQRYL